MYYPACSNCRPLYRLLGSRYYLGSGCQCGLQSAGSYTSPGIHGRNFLCLGRASWCQGRQSMRGSA